MGTPTGSPLGCQGCHSRYTKRVPGGGSIILGWDDSYVHLPNTGAHALTSKCKCKGATAQWTIQGMTHLSGMHRATHNCEFVEA